VGACDCLTEVNLLRFDVDIGEIKILYQIEDNALRCSGGVLRKLASRAYERNQAHGSTHGEPS
jgi:hypothetical protein